MDAAPSAGQGGRIVRVSTGPIMELDNVRFGYQHGVTVIDKITAGVSPGRLLGLIGPCP